MTCAQIKRTSQIIGFWKQVGCAPAQSGTFDGWEQVQLERGDEKN